MKPKLILLLLITTLFLSGWNSERQLSGEVVKRITDKNGNVTSLVIQTDDGAQVGILVTPQTLTWSSAIVSEEFAFDKQDKIFVTVTCEKNSQKLTANDGTEITAYTAKEISSTELLTQNVFTMSDGTKVDLLYRSSPPTFSNTYQLSDGTELLYEPLPHGPENVYAGGAGSFDELSEAARLNISAYYENQGLLYDVQEQVEQAYSDYSNLPEGTEFNSHTVSQEISPTASNDRIMYFLTSVMLPDNGDTCTELRLGAAFDRETGEHINTLDLFSCEKQEIVQKLITIAEISDPALQSEIKAAFQPEYVVFFPENMEISFPQGVLPSQEFAFQIGFDYDEKLSAILYDWAIP